MKSMLNLNLPLSLPVSTTTTVPVSPTRAAGGGAPSASAFQSILAVAAESQGYQSTPAALASDFRMTPPIKVAVTDGQMRTEDVGPRVTAPSRAKKPKLEQPSLLSRPSLPESMVPAPASPNQTSGPTTDPTIDLPASFSIRASLADGSQAHAVPLLAPTLTPAYPASAVAAASAYNANGGADTRVDLASLVAEPAQIPEPVNTPSADTDSKFDGADPLFDVANPEAPPAQELEPKSAQPVPGVSDRPTTPASEGKALAPLAPTPAGDPTNEIASTTSRHLNISDRHESPRWSASSRVDDVTQERKFAPRWDTNAGHQTLGAESSSPKASGVNDPTDIQTAPVPSQAPTSPAGAAPSNDSSLTVAVATVEDMTPRAATATPATQAGANMAIIQATARAEIDTSGLGRISVTAREGDVGVDVRVVAERKSSAEVLLPHLGAIDSEIRAGHVLVHRLEISSAGYDGGWMSGDTGNSSGRSNTNDQAEPSDAPAAAAPPSEGAPTSAEARVRIVL